jgi:hypothetical protein
MGRRSVNLFKRNDVMRAVNAARDAGVPVATVEIGTIFRVHGPDARHEQPLDTWLQGKEKRGPVSPEPSKHPSPAPQGKTRAATKVRNDHRSQ